MEHGLRNCKTLHFRYSYCKLFEGRATLMDVGYICGGPVYSIDVYGTIEGVTVNCVRAVRRNIVDGFKFYSAIP